MAEIPSKPLIKDKSSSPLNLTFKPGRQVINRKDQTSEPKKNKMVSMDTDSNRLTVGRNIVLNGEIRSCEKLVVDGTVEAKLDEAHSIVISSSGHFKGNADVNDADISGTFEGTLSAKNLVIIRKSGKIIGSLTYGRITIEDGGQVVGDMSCMDPLQSTLENE